MYRYRLLDAKDGADLGPFVSARPAYAAGQTIARATGELVTVVNLTAGEPGDLIHGYLVVTPTGSGSAQA